MWRVTAPTIPVATVLAACVATIRDPVRKAGFLATSDDLTDAATKFWTALETNTLHQLPEIDAIGDMTRDDMIWLYDQKMVPAQSPARNLYDIIKMAAPSGKCPLCGRGSVYSLDHHLPKAKFADLTITPSNLVPACQDCNKTKTQAAPDLAAEETIHPYFDDIDGDIWLKASVVEVAPAALFYFADPPALWSQTMQRRVRNHFRVFKLRKGYASEGATLLSNMRGYLESSVAKQGAQGIREYLMDQALSCRMNRQNSWEAASYTALAESDWFCGGGYVLRG